MRGRFKPKINHHSEFELDLAPLLAVMVKLVPVLLVSSAFVQMMIIETDLPQVVKQAIEIENKNPTPTSIAVDLSKKTGCKITITKNGHQTVETIAFEKDQLLNLSRIHIKFQEIKKQHPEVFKIIINPDDDIPYKEVVQIMDEARKSRNSNIQFPIKDLKTGLDTKTLYMFPEVVFGNTMDG